MDMMTYTKKIFSFDVEKINENEIDLADIVYPLSRQCRYNGQIPYFYSVLEHSILCAFMIKPEYKLEALFHDAHEAYMGDIVTGMKHIFKGLEGIENRIQKLIIKKFNLNYSLKCLEEVKKVDKALLKYEMKFFGFSEAYIESANLPDIPFVDYETKNQLFFAAEYLPGTHSRIFKRVYNKYKKD